MSSQTKSKTECNTKTTEKTRQIADIPKHFNSLMDRIDAILGLLDTDMLVDESDPRIVELQEHFDHCMALSDHCKGQGLEYRRKVMSEAWGDLCDLIINLTEDEYHNVLRAPARRCKVRDRSVCCDILGYQWSGKNTEEFIQKVCEVCPCIHIEECGESPVHYLKIMCPGEEQHRILNPQEWFVVSKTDVLNPLMARYQILEDATATLFFQPYRSDSIFTD